MAAAQSSLETLKDAEKAAADALEATREQLMTAAGAVAHEKAAAEQSGQVKEANRAKRRAELETDKMTAEARLKEVTAAEQTVYEATVVEQQFKIAADARDSAIAAVERAERAFEHATVRTALEQLIERETAVTRAAGQLGAARQHEQDARGQPSSRRGGGCRRRGPSRPTPGRVELGRDQGARVRTPAAPGGRRTHRHRGITR